MTLYYDTKIFNKFKKLAIGEETQLKIGEVYYTNSYPEKFVLNEIFHHDGDKDKLIITDSGDTLFLKDNNIGASYNPWLIFEKEEDSKACKEELVITYEYDEGYDDWDEGYDDWIENND